MKTKKCTVCKKTKLIRKFSKNKNNLDGHMYRCKECRKKGRKSRNMFVCDLYSGQLKRSRQSGYGLPEYNLEQLRTWIFVQDNFEQLYVNWEKSGFDRNLTPSVDRLDDYKGYSFGNIRLVTWRENMMKGNSDRVNGINNKANYLVVGFNLKENIEFEYHSINEAERQTGICQSNIVACCKGKRNTAGGYVWNYKNERKRMTLSQAYHVSLNQYCEPEQVKKIDELVKHLT